MSPKLTRKLKLETIYRQRDDAGGYTETWQQLGELWAEVIPGSGRETDLSGLTVATVPCKITVRAAPHGAPSRPLPGQRFRDGERLFRILAVTEADPAIHYLTCTTREEEVTA